MKSYSGTKGIIVGFHKPFAERDPLGEIFVKSFKDGRVIAWQWNALEWVGTPTQEEEAIYLMFRLQLEVDELVYKKFLRLLNKALLVSNNLSTQSKISEYSTIQEEVEQLAKLHTPYFDKVLPFFPSMQ